MSDTMNDHADEWKDLKAGLEVDVVVSTDYRKEISDVRRAIIYETEKNRLILSQTSPPFTRFYIQRDMLITYLIRKADEMVRVGVFGKLTDFINYRLASSERVQAIVMALKSGAELLNLRRHFRVRPSPDQGIIIYLDNEPMNIIDISVGGAMLCHPSGGSIMPNERRKIVMVVESERFSVEVTVLRVWSPPTERQGLEYISIQFLNLDNRLNYLLGGKIFRIKRETLSK